MHQIIIPKSSLKASVYEMQVWANENCPTVLKESKTVIKEVNGRTHLIGFQFFFRTEEDAAAFKLAWL